MRFSGLILDQNQGFLFYSPILWLGLFGIVSLFRYSRLVGVVWLLSVILFLVPSAAHPGSYGGGSFVGRYGWGAAMLFIIPTLFVLVRISRQSRSWLFVVLAASLLFSAWIFITQVFVGGTYPGGPVALDLYTKPADTWLESYSVFYFPLQQFVPALYDLTWAWSFGTNWVWLAAVVGVIVMSFLVVNVPMRSRMLGVIAGIGVVAVIAAGVLSVPGEELVVVEQNVVAANPGVVAGVVAGGPTLNMREGAYAWSVEYRSDASGVAGKWELLATKDATPVATGELPATDGGVGVVTQEIPFRSFQPRGFTLRVSWYGEGTFEVLRTSVSRN
jgi:hypothetical protein